MISTSSLVLDGHHGHGLGPAPGPGPGPGGPHHMAFVDPYLRSKFPGAVPEFIRPFPKPAPMVPRFNGQRPSPSLSPPPRKDFPSVPVSSTPASGPVNLTSVKLNGDNISDNHISTTGVNIQIPHLTAAAAAAAAAAYTSRMFPPPGFPYSGLQNPYGSMYPSSYSSLLNRPTYINSPPSSPLERQYSPTQKTNGGNPNGPGVFLQPAGNYPNPNPPPQSAPPPPPPPPVQSGKSAGQPVLREKRPFKIPSGKETSGKQKLPSSGKITAKRVTLPSNVNNNNNNLLPPNFTKGSLIQLANGDLRRVEDVTTEELVSSAERCPAFRSDPSTVVRIEENNHGTVLLTLSYGENKKTSPSNLSNESDGEPVAKIARFAYNKQHSNDEYDENYENENSDECQALNLDEESSKDDEDWSMDTAVDAKDLNSESEKVFTATMVGSNRKETNESIFGIGDSASTRPTAKSPTIGTKSKNANIFLGDATNHESELRVDSVKESSKTGSGTRGSNNGGSCGTSAGKHVSGIEEKDFTRSTDIEHAGSGPNQVNRSKERPPNTGTFTCKHLDTDSEQEKAMISEKRRKENNGSKEDLEGKDVGTTSSEEGWTYATEITGNCGDTRQKPRAAARLNFNDGSVSGLFQNSKEIKYSGAKIIPKANTWNSKEPISSINKMLADRADELVRYKQQTWKTRTARVKRWLKGDESKPLDSCDASGEYTTEDSDKESQSSEDYDGSVSTCRKSGSTEGILEETLTLKSQFERHPLRNRPWSMSSVSRLRSPRNDNLKSRTSVSESALNQMMARDDKEKSKEFCLSSTKSKLVPGEENNGNCSRRKRTKIRKRTSKKTDSGSDGVTLSENGDSPNLSSPTKQFSNFSGLVKSGSFSGVIRKPGDFTKNASVSGTETDEESTNSLNPPIFRLGPKTGAVSVTNDQGKVQVEEQLSFNSDQAYWEDNYQEIYQSETYSEEPPDSDTAKNLLDFGEDYGKFLGNQSDCASSGWGHSHTGRRRKKLDSDSDVDEIKKVLRQSLDQLQLSELMLNKTFIDLLPATNLISEESVAWTFSDKIITTCERNIRCLSKFLEEGKDEALSSNEYECIQSVKERWENLKASTELHLQGKLQKDMATLKEEFLNLAAGVESRETVVNSREELEEKILQVKKDLNLIREKKWKLRQANLSVHMFLTTTKHAESSLKDEVTDLYQVWDQAFFRVSAQLCNLQSLSQVWLQFEDQLHQLRCDLKMDEDRLRDLDGALKCGTPTTDVAISLRDIARVLSEKEPNSKNAHVIVNGSTTTVKAPGPVLNILSTEGSLSDSGISDSGSEQELSEREKRLAQLKRLAKNLESILAPGSQTLLNMFQQLEDAELGLRDLQKTCRDLIVRSASSNEFRMIADKSSSMNSLVTNLDTESCTFGISKLSPGKRLRSRGSYIRKMDVLGDFIDDDGTEDSEDGKGKKFWLWRLMRFALPFQLALFALLCVAFMMKPKCCDSLNNLGMSLNPQLRYESGPPPV